MEKAAETRVKEGKKPGGGPLKDVAAEEGKSYTICMETTLW